MPWTGALRFFGFGARCQVIGDRQIFVALGWSGVSGLLRIKMTSIQHRGVDVALDL